MNPNGNEVPTNGGAATPGGGGYPNQGVPNNGSYMGAAGGQNPAGNAASTNGYAGNGTYACRLISSTARSSLSNFSRFS